MKQKKKKELVWRPDRISRAEEKETGDGRSAEENGVKDSAVKLDRPDEGGEELKELRFAQYAGSRPAQGVLPSDRR